MKAILGADPLGITLKDAVKETLLKEWYTPPIVDSEKTKIH